MRPLPPLDAVDTVYPPMAWTARWSDGENIPLGILLQASVQAALGTPSFYPKGLWIFSEEGHGIFVLDNAKHYAGLTVIAHRGDEAEVRLLNLIETQK